MSALIHALLMEMLKRRSRRTPRADRDLIVAPSEFGSVGDLAMVEGLHRLLAASRRTPPLLAAIAHGEGWSGAGELHSPSEIPARASESFQWFREDRSFSHVYLIGADVLDGAYSVRRSLQRLRFCALSSAAGARVTITGCSFRPDPQPAIVRALRALPREVRICARDPGSKRRLEDILGREVEAVADLAFLVAPDPAGVVARECLERLAEIRVSGRRIVALCPNRSAVGLGSGTGSREERAMRCVDAFEQVARAVLRMAPDAAFALMAHDSRGPFDDDALCDMLHARLGDSVALRVASSTRPSEIKAILSGCDALLTGRMHCGIAAIGAGTPAVFLDYQGKVEGLAALTDAARVVRFGGDRSTPPDDCARLLIELTTPQAAWRTSAPAQLARIEAMARATIFPG
jgi:hypothetical protein